MTDFSILLGGWVDSDTDYWHIDSDDSLEERSGAYWTKLYYYSGTDLDLPVRSFSKKRELNKIIFTDGYAYDSMMPKEDLKRENVIWIVYGNKNFNPCCGKVINITERQLEQLHLVNRDTLIEDASR